MHGGRREGAGRPKGVRSGSTLKRAQELDETRRRVEERLPDAFQGDAHELLVEIYKDKTHPLSVRIDAAKAAIGYEKPKLGSVQHTGDAQNPVAYQILSGVTRQDDAADHDDDSPHPTH